MADAPVEMLVARMVVVYTRSQRSITPVKYDLNSAQCSCRSGDYELGAPISYSLLHQLFSPHSFVAARLPPREESR